MNGTLIAFEGLDGSGKATQTQLLCTALEKRGQAVRCVSFPDYNEPSSTLVKMYLAGEFGRDASQVNPYAASSFYALDRFASFQKFWKQDYEAGQWIIADRYSTSNIVFQMEKFPREQWDAFIDWVQEYEYGLLGLPKPDLTIYLDMPAQVSQKLLSQRYCGDESKKDIHESNAAFLAACGKSAEYAAKKLGWRVINCADGANAKSVQQIHEEIMRII